MSGPLLEHNPQLLGDIRQLIEQSRRQLANTVNSALTLLYWHIGRRIRSDVLHQQRGGYGEQIVSALSRQLEAEYGRGFSEKNLRHMLGFAEAFPEPRTDLLKLDASGIHVADYFTALSSKELLQAKLHEAIALSRARLDKRSGEDA